ncbi:MAG: LemA family protein [Microgenomates group bacterium ADurb.Bin219]|nr:MAG: LemA family protein [Microgenomates group bacterium ADurb.Bin219]HNP89366.1 LemA family protein [Candidatus Woesebacteria bacterium]
MIILAVLAVIALYALSIYNKLVSFKARIKASVQEIGNQLKRQADLIPNLMESVKGYLKHEKEIFKDLTAARKAVLEATKGGDAQKMVDVSQQLQSSFGKLIAVVESTPQLRSVEAVTKLMDEVRDTADKLMYSRRVLIDLSADYNVMIVTFPASIIANLFGFKEEKGLVMPEEDNFREVTEEETVTPKVKLD